MQWLLERRIGRRNKSSKGNFDFDHDDENDDDNNEENDSRSERQQQRRQHRLQWWHGRTITVVSTHQQTVNIDATLKNNPLRDSTCRSVRCRCKLLPHIRHASRMGTH